MQIFNYYTRPLVVCDDSLKTFEYKYFLDHSMALIEACSLMLNDTNTMFILLFKYKSSETILSILIKVFLKIKVS
jgi:hypothetical protein